MRLDTLTNILLESGSPIVFLDTCSILDLYRCFYRSNALVSHLHGFRNLQQAIKQGTLQSVIAYKAIEEVKQQSPLSAKESEAEFTKAMQNNLRIIETLHTLNQGYMFHVDGMSEIKLSSIIKNEIDNFINLSHIVEQDDDSWKLGMMRSEKGEAPAKKGKNEQGDCIIIEHYLKLASQLRTEGFSSKIFFITSNKEDFGPISKASSPLDQQFIDRDITYVNNFSAVAYNFE